jgi:molybdopterin-guanine dinucleotide biosynthesis protein A
MGTACTGVILAGGGATRYGGRPKGLEAVNGARIIDRVVEALRPVATDLLLIANAPDADGWLPGVRTRPDLRKDEGVLGGLHAALTHAGTDILLVAWDMPFVPRGLLAALRARGEAAPLDGHTVDVVIPESDHSRRGLEPLCAWYSHRCLEAVTRALDAGDRRAIAFHDDVRVARLPVAEVAAFGDPALMFSNVNTPGDLDEAARRDAPRG